MLFWDVLIIIDYMLMPVCLPTFMSACLLVDPQIDPANKPEDFKDLYHAVIPIKDIRERVPLLVRVRYPPCGCAGVCGQAVNVGLKSMH